MNPAQITRLSQSFLPSISPASFEAESSHAQSPHQTRTHAFVASGELNAAFGRTSTSPTQDFTRLLGAVQRELESESTSFPAVAELANQLAEAAMGEHWPGHDEQQVLKGVIDRCTSQLAHTPVSHPSRDALSQVCESLKTARLHQSISHMLGESHATVRGVPDLLALIHIDPKVLADKPVSMPSHVKFGSFICLARARAAQLSESLNSNSGDVAHLLHPHADTLLGLEKLPEALAALTENCPDTSTQDDLRALAEEAGGLLQQLRSTGLLPRSGEVSGESAETLVPSCEVVEPKLTLGQALLKAGGDGPLDGQRVHLEGLRHAPTHVASSDSGSRAPARAAGDSQKAAGLYAEKKRTNWTHATGVAGKIAHKIESLLGMRDAQSRVQAFVAFMADGKGKADATTLDLGDGWMRVTRVIKGATALIDFKCDSDGLVVDARHPGRFPLLPEGHEREAFNTVLQELKFRGAETLSKVPVYYVNRNTRGYVIPTHGYVVAGHPNRGRKSGAVLYGVGGDPKRGPVALDEKLLDKLIGRSDSKTSCTLSAPVRAAISLLAGSSFATREEFHDAYCEVRGDAVDPLELHNEISSIYRLLPLSTMEMWPKKADDYRVARPAAPERDLRAFENLPKDIGRKARLKKVSNVDSIDLLEAKRQFTLHQLYQDEVLGRDGTGVSSTGLQSRVDAQRRDYLLASTPKFQRLPPHATDKVGNCNTGASSLLQRAVDTYTEKNNLPPEKVTAASIFGIGSSHRLAIWDPLSGSSSRKPFEDR
ncbi:HopW family type III effector protein [Pseudomonas syringae]|nr:HopW family type III effector protein [Pseudomonas syringae]EPM46612.1 type III secreted effector hopPmaA [Pseudomonas syringae pv. actinidiae ICMP 19098]EPN17955.1 type III secreted effector hopPmaA [Pseudomonas syringae pv. actinidiae ICMP 19100]EPN25480.1 type III secreted effector hopPmaA [Pseudomonas syringae pv. actinidiae ICMP 19099]EPN35617.1 type III secreted effector hopPmaA [Pseudomonas syringae pv. actinidiae ICMP 18883]EPN42129.1 type III secreted effector hopPmaA [Pseudomonas 